MHIASTLAAPPTYQRHRPERTVLYSIISRHYPRFVQAIEGYGGHLPQFVRQEFEEYLKCGLLEHGFLRVKCDGCRHEHLVAYSCKRRGFCPSCGARRMVESAAHLVDHVFPEVPVRQFVLTFPFPLRFLLAAEPKALTEVLAVVQRGISTFLIRQTGLNTRNNPQLSTTLRTGLDIDGEYTLQPLCPVHRRPRFVIVDLAARPARHDLMAMLEVGGENSMESCEIQSEPWNQCRQARNKIQRLQNHMR